MPTAENAHSAKQPATRDMTPTPVIKPMASVCLIALCMAALVGNTPTAALTVTVNNVRSDQGQVRVAVYTQDNWLGQEPFARVWTPPKGDSVTAKFTLPPGEYAVAVLHDLNDNGRMDYRLLRLPKEPFGFSNGAKPKLGPPRFEDAAFPLGEEGLSIAIELRG